MAPTAAETTDAILRNARAAENERLRNLARTRYPELSDAELDDKVRELQAEKLSGAGRRGRANQQRITDIGKNFQAAQPDLEADLLKIIERLRALNPPRDGEAA